MKIKLPGSDKTKSAKSPINILFAWVILVIALTLTGFYTYNTKLSVEKNARKEFSFECGQIKGSVTDRLFAHAAVLRSGAAFIEACDTVTRKEWEVFISNQKTDKNLPGVQGLGYATIVSGESLKNHEQHIRKSGFPDYSIKPAGDRKIYTSIIYIEPFSDRNLKAFGYDMFSEPIRRDAMEKARDFNIASLSGKVKLVQETDTDIQTGTLMYVPVYRSGLPINTVAERRRAIKGWSYSPYRMNDFMFGVLGNYKHKLEGSIRMQIYDSDSIRPEAILFDSQSAEEVKPAGSNMLYLQLPLVFNGKKWTLHFSKAKGFSTFYPDKDVLLVLIGGTTLSFLFFLLTLFWLKNRYRLKLTTQLAGNLTESLDKHVALYNAIPDAVFVTDGKTDLIEEVNKMASEQYGYTNDEFIRLNSASIKYRPLPNETSELKSVQFLHDQYHIKKDNTIFPVEISTSTFEYSNAQKIITVARDSTERIKAETDLSLKNEAFGNSIAAQGITDKNGFFTHVNQAFVKMAGYDSETEITGKTIDTFFADKTNTAKDLEILLTTGSWQGELKAKRKNGSIIIIKAFATSIHNKQGVNIGYQTTSLDITKEKEAELELQKSKDRYQTLVENVNDAIVVSLQDKIVFANQRFYDFIGFSEQEVLSDSYLRYIHPYDREDLVRNYLKLIEGNPLQRYPSRVIIHDGSIKWAEFSGVTIAWDGEPAVLSFIVDITERKLAEDSLRAIQLKLAEINQMLNLIIESIPVRLFWKDKNLTYIGSNTFFANDAGKLSPSEITGLKDTDLFRPEQAALFNSDDLEVMNSGIPKIKYEEIQITPAGERIWVQTSKIPLRDLENNIIGVLGTYDDISERKQSDKLLRATLKEKEILLREVHHRVKNNLQVVSSLLNLQANKITDKAIKEILEQSRNRIRSIALVHEKLYQTGNFAEVNIKEYTRSLVTELFRVYMADPQKIHIRTEIQDVNIPLIYAIPYGLILNEIISNSLKYAFPKDHSHTLKPEIFIILKTLPNKYLQLCAGDNGIGLPDGYPLNDSLSLGLYLIRILSTEQLEGEIEIDNKKGTIFTITFNPYSKRT